MATPHSACCSKLMNQKELMGEHMRRRNYFWAGFAAGATSGVAALLGVNALLSAHQKRILRLERSLQIGKPIGEVFDAWTQLERLPAMSPLIRDVEFHGRRS